MGAVYQSVCYADAATAAAAFCAAGYPRTDGGDIRMCSSAAGSVVITTGSTSTTVPLSFPSCDPGDQYADMTAVFGIACAALALVWGLKTFVLKLVTNW